MSTTYFIVYLRDSFSEDEEAYRR